MLPHILGKLTAADFIESPDILGDCIGVQEPEGGRAPESLLWCIETENLTLESTS